jgi:hypothetical protein
VVAERDRRDDQPDAVVGHRRDLGHAVVVDQPPAVAGDLDAVDAEAARQRLLDARARQAVLADQVAHRRGQLLVLAPLLEQDLADLALGLGVDQVHLARPGLAEPLDAVHRLDRVVEAVVDPGEHHLVGLLQVQPDAEHHRLAEQDRRLAGRHSARRRSASSVVIEPSIDENERPAAASARSSARCSSFRWQ